MKFLFIFLFIGFFQVSFAQKVGKHYTIRLKEGSSIKAQIVEINKDVWIISNSTLGSIPIDRVQIASILEENGKEIVINRERFTRASIVNPAPERYFFLPSAFNLPKGKQNYQNILIFISAYNYGITDRLSIGLTIPTFLVIPFPAGTFHLKYSFPLAEKIRLGFQMDMGGYIVPYFVQGMSETGMGFLPQAVISFGSEKRNTSLHLGRGVILAITNFNLFGVSHISPISGRTFFLTQNKFIFNDLDLFLMPSLGIRISGKSRKGSLDLGLIGVIDMDFGGIEDALLHIAFQRRLGKKR